jgi:hypothetical protein
MKVVFEAPKGAGGSLRYQRYYQLGLSEVATLRWRAAARVTARFARGGSDAGHVGRYEVEGRRFVIDARDNHVADDEAALAWADVYFKANRWRDVSYPDHVVPLVNGNGFVGPREIELLRSLRATAKEVDVAFISNLWGGREHNVRIFEELASSGLSTDLLAVLPEGADPEDDRILAARLEAVGVRATRKQVPIEELWRRLARARVVVFRSGRHLCIPWRMIDLLAMGATILFDAEPLPQWPSPLRECVQYASIGIERPAWDPPAETEYDKVVPAVRDLAADSERRRQLAVEAAAYFDEYAAPHQVARYLLDTAIIAPR